MHDRDTKRGGGSPPRMRGMKRAAVAALVLPVVVGGFMLQSAVSEGGRLFEEVLTRVATAYDEVEDVMRGQTYRSGIPAGLPAGTAVANKTGWIDGHTHDMAVVRPDGEAAFVLVVLTRLAGVPNDQAEARIAEVAREAWGRRRP